MDYQLHFSNPTTEDNNWIANKSVSLSSKVHDANIFLLRPKAWDFMHKGCRLKNLQLLNLVYIYLAIENSKPNNKMLEDNCFPLKSTLLIVKDVWNIPQM